MRPLIDVCFLNKSRHQKWSRALPLLTHNGHRPYSNSGLICFDELG